jgi:protein-disulfide isomerase
LGGGVRFAFRHFPLTEIHSHALAASAAAEAAALQDRFWPMHERLFHGQKALADDGPAAVRRRARARRGAVRRRPGQRRRAGAHPPGRGERDCHR